MLGPQLHNKYSDKCTDINIVNVILSKILCALVLFNMWPYMWPVLKLLKANNANAVPPGPEVLQLKKKKVLKFLAFKY